jgi:hypothetical protein
MLLEDEPLRPEGLKLLDELAPLRDAVFTDVRVPEGVA